MEPEYKPENEFMVPKYVPKSEHQGLPGHIAYALILKYLYWNPSIY